MKNKIVLWIVLAIVIILVLGGALGFAGYYAGYRIKEGRIQKQEEAKTETQEETSQEEEGCASCGGSETEEEEHCLENPATGSGNITITSPIAQAEVTSPIVVKGKANVFEGSFIVRLMDCETNEISSALAQTTGGDIGQMNPYSVSLIFSQSYVGQKAYIEAYSLSAKDGTVQDLIQIPVRLK